MLVRKWNVVWELCAAGFGRRAQERLHFHSASTSKEQVCTIAVSPDTTIPCRKPAPSCDHAEISLQQPPGPPFLGNYCPLPMPILPHAVSHHVGIPGQPRLSLLSPSASAFLSSHAGFKVGFTWLGKIKAFNGGSFAKGECPETCR